MTREQRIVTTFFELADTMVDDLDVVEFLHRGSVRPVELLDCAEAGLLLADVGLVRRVMASSNARSDALELWQFQTEEWPCPGALTCSSSSKRGRAGLDFRALPASTGPVLAAAARR